MKSKVNKSSDIIKRCAAFLLVTALFLTVTCLVSFAATVGMMTENIPDTNIGGATGGASEFVSEVASDIMSGDNTPAGTAAPPPSDTSGAIISSPEQSTTKAPVQSTTEGADTGDEKDSRSVIGIVIAIVAVVALVLIILIFIPKNGDKGGSSGIINDNGSDDMMRR